MGKNADLVEFDIQVDWNVLVNICLPRSEFRFALAPIQAKKMALDMFLASEEVLAIQRERGEGNKEGKGDNSRDDSSGN